MVYTLDIIRSGWTKPISKNQFTSACTISLLLGLKNILIDPGSPWDSEYIEHELKKRNLNTDSIDYLICTHGHVDHIGSIECFPNAVTMIGRTLIKRQNVDQYVTITDPFEIDNHVHIVYTPGHTEVDVSVIVDHVETFGKLAIVGDLFECEEDVSNSSLWKCSSSNVELQNCYRKKIFDSVEYIVPGHGPLFKKPWPTYKQF